MKLVTSLVLATVTAANAATVRSAKTTQILNTFKYEMAGGEIDGGPRQFLVWSESLGYKSLVFTEYPAQGEAGEFKEKGGLCLVLRVPEDESFGKSLELDECNGTKLRPGYGSRQNQLQVVDPGFSLCYRKYTEEECADTGGEYCSEIKECPYDQGGDVCVSEDDMGSVTFAPCSLNYPTTLSNPVYPEGYVNTGISEVDDFYYIYPNVEKYSKDLGKRWFTCVMQEGKWNIINDRCFGPNGGDECEAFDTLEDCRQWVYTVGERDEATEMVGDDLYSNLDWPILEWPSKGTGCWKIDTSGSQYEGSWVTVTYDINEKRTSCVEDVETKKCKVHVDSDSCVETLVQDVGRDSTILKACSDKDQKDSQSWCYQVELFLR